MVFDCRSILKRSADMFPGHINKTMDVCGRLRTLHLQTPNEPLRMLKLLSKKGITIPNFTLACAIQ